MTFRVAVLGPAGEDDGGGLSALASTAKLNGVIDVVLDVPVLVVLFLLIVVVVEELASSSSSSSLML
jgi:hypothetical protein